MIKILVDVVTLAFTWHKAIHYRRKEEITLTHHQFFVYHNKYETIIFWLNNCVQNQKRAFIRYLIYVINFY